LRRGPAEYVMYAGSRHPFTRHRSSGGIAAFMLWPFAIGHGRTRCVCSDAHAMHLFRASALAP